MIVQPALVSEGNASRFTFLPTFNSSMEGNMRASTSFSEVEIGCLARTLELMRDIEGDHPKPNVDELEILGSLLSKTEAMKLTINRKKMAVDAPQA